MQRIQASRARGRARRARRYCAAGGTIFLDEIGELAPALQAKLLRVLERKIVTRLGGSDEVAVDVRVIAATHRDVEAEVRAGRFRDDLSRNPHRVAVAVA